MKLDGLNVLLVDDSRNMLRLLEEILRSLKPRPFVQGGSFVGPDRRRREVPFEGPDRCSENAEVEGRDPYGCVVET